MRLFLFFQNNFKSSACIFTSVFVMWGTAVAAESRLPIIDMHVHAFDGDWTAENTPLNPATKEPSAAATSNDLLEQTLAYMERYNVVKGIASGSMDLVHKWVAAGAGRFIGSPIFPVGFTVNNSDGWPDMNMLKKEVLAGRIGALGEITTQYDGLPPATAKMDPYYRFAVEHGIPVAIHMAGSGAPGKPKLELALGKPLLLEDVLKRYPDLRIYMMHAGFPFLDEMIALMIHYPHLYVDLGWISWATPQATYYNYLRGLMDAELGKRIMYGSDQAWWPEAIGLSIERIEKAEFLTDTQKRDILYNNAVRFLAIE